VHSGEQRTGNRAPTVPGGGPPGSAASGPARRALAPGGRPEACSHAPRCPPPWAPGRLAGRVIISHPEQGWSLLCNGVVVFDDGGAILPGGSVIEPGRMTCQPDTSGTPQAGHVRTVAPVPAGRAREGGLRRPGPVAALASWHAPGGADGTAPSSPPHAGRAGGWRVPVPAAARHRGPRERMAADAW
jgi:hypothetical protein